MERIIGIDIGLRNTGYGILDFGQNTEKIIEGGVIKTDSKENLDERLLTIFNDLNYVYKNTTLQLHLWKTFIADTEILKQL